MMRSIREILEKIKRFQNPLFLMAALLLTASLGFGLGRLSRIEEGREPVRIMEAPIRSGTQTAAVSNPVAPSAGGQYVASKNGTKYHLPWCAGAQSIKAENKVYFNTKTEAEKAGYSPAANCKGI